MNHDLFDVRDSVCLVTGASSGIGVAIAAGLAEGGAKVVLAARRLDRLQKFERSLSARGYSAKAIKCDVTDERDVSAAVAETVDSYKSLDVLVNNAGITHVSPTHQLSLEDWRRVLDVNLTGVFLCAKHASKRMIEQKKGKIINISSVYGVMADTSPELPYYASKAGVIGLSRQLALELAPYNIQVNAIAPGFFSSEMTKPIFEDADALSYTLSRIPMNRVGLPEELSGVARFLASRASDYVTGQLIVVDGGWSLW
jgi:gluconate 5-dehydrogenase